MRSLKPYLTRLLAVLALAALLIILFFAGRSYYSRYYYVAARWGEKSVTDYEALLRRSVEHEPGYGRSNQELARVMMSQKKYAEALKYQTTAMNSYRPLASYEQLGTIQERLAESGIASTEAAEDWKTAALENYSRTLRMFPDKVSALERLAGNAASAGNEEKLDELAGAISKAAPHNMNGLYFQAVAAERSGASRNALIRYQRILAAGPPPRGALYTHEQLTQRIRALRAKER